MSNDVLQCKDVTLDTVKNLFAEWREARTSKREPIPDRLWHAAAALTHDGHYKIHQICSELRLNQSAFKKLTFPTPTKLISLFYQTINSPRFWIDKNVRSKV